MINKRASFVGIALVKFLPIVALILMVLVGEFDMILSAMVAAITALIIDMVVDKRSFRDSLNAGINNVKEVVPVMYILILAYAMGNCFMSTGVGAVIINSALKIGISAKTVALVAFLVSCVLSVASGSSWGTMAACAPILLWLNYVVGGNVALTAAAVMGGSCFGDNIGLISDTTVLACGVQNVKISDRVKHQGIWSLLCVITTCIILIAVGLSYSGDVVDPHKAIEQIPQETWDFLAEKRPSAVDLLMQVQAKDAPIYMFIPLILVVVLAIKGVDTLLCLSSGIVSSYILGLLSGSVSSTTEFLNDCVLSGFEEAGEWTIVMMMFTTMFAGIMLNMNAFEPIAYLIKKISRKVNHMLTCNALLAILANAALGDETAMILTAGPIAKEVTDEIVDCNEEDMYKLRLKNATILDAFGVFTASLIPWHSQSIFYISLCSAIFPLYKFTHSGVIKYNYMAIITVVSLLILVFTGLNRFIPGFGTPGPERAKIKGNK